MAKLTARTIKEGLKNGVGAQELCEKFSLSMEQLEEKIKILFSNNPKITTKIMSELKANDKKRRKQQKAGRSNSSKTPEEPEENSVIDDLEENREVKVPDEAEKSSETLDGLKNLALDLSNQVIKLESKHKGQAQEHKALIKRLRALKAKIEEIKAALKEAGEEYRQIVEKNNTLVSSMNEISRSRARKVAELELIREKIREQNKVAVGVFIDGSIVTLDEAEIILDESGSEELYSVLLGKPECEDLKVKDIKILSRILSIVKNSDRELVLLFDNSKMEKIFYLLSVD